MLSIISELNRSWRLRGESWKLIFSLFPWKLSVSVRPGFLRPETMPRRPAETCVQDDPALLKPHRIDQLSKLQPLGRFPPLNTWPSSATEEGYREVPHRAQYFEVRACWKRVAISCQHLNFHESKDTICIWQVYVDQCRLVRLGNWKTSGWAAYLSRRSWRTWGSKQTINSSNASMQE